ncbi:MAG: glycosyl hydrolase family 17 protein [Bacteroidota bacterium]
MGTPPNLMKRMLQSLGIGLFAIVFLSCQNTEPKSESSNDTPTKKEVTAKDILGNPAYQAISYGGYRHRDHGIEPTIAELKEDMKILYAMGIRVLRTYKLHLPHASNVVKAIRELKTEDPDFEMYVMLGVWINCENAFTENPNHDGEDEEANAKEIEQSIVLANEYPDIVKVIAVGNEAMVKWAASYFVQPGVILRWVNHLQELKSQGDLNPNVWITSSDNFASWGGGGEEYHVDDLNALIKAVDFISLHTYPMHDTHYNPAFWGNFDGEADLTDLQKIDSAMHRARDYAVAQFNSVASYVEGLGVEKPMHIGETGWASASNGHYGPEGSIATDEYKEALYHQLIRAWTTENKVACFYFEAFDEHWKDASNPGGSENHFGLFKIDGTAKYALWDLVDQGVFEGLGRGGKPIGKTYNGNKDSLLQEILVPPVKEGTALTEYKF